MTPQGFTHAEALTKSDTVEVHGHVPLATPVRTKPGSVNNPYEFYRRRFADMEVEVQATAADSSMATFRMESGAMVSWVVGLGGHGHYDGEVILGELGVIKGFGTRGGRALLQPAGQQDQTHEQLVAAAGDFELEPLAAYFFPEGIANDDVDWKLLALEYYEFGEAILHDRQIEVDGSEGLKDVAALYAIFESSRLGRTVSMAEVERASVYDYQAEIDAELDL